MRGLLGFRFEWGRPLYRAVIEGPRRLKMAKYPGSLPERAKAAGMSASAFAEKNKGADGALGKMARMYFVKESPGLSGKAKLDQPGDNRKKGQPLYQVG